MKWIYISFPSANSPNTYLVLEEMASFFDARADIYDSHMLDDLRLGGFYQTVTDCFDAPVTRLLDLGCGTGLELERLFERLPDMEVTGIDMSAEMLKKLQAKYQTKRLRLICGSYFDEDFGGLYVRNGYEALLPELLSWAEKELSVISDGKHNLKVWITGKESEKQDLLPSAIVNYGKRSGRNDYIN